MSGKPLSEEMCDHSVSLVSIEDVMTFLDFSFYL
jgi:hypothetical protein